MFICTFACAPASHAAAPVPDVMTQCKRFSLTLIVDIHCYIREQTRGWFRNALGHQPSQRCYLVISVHTSYERQAAFEHARMFVVLK